MTTTETSELTCPKCPERGPFKNKNAVNMHKMRVHTRAGRLGAMWKMKKPKLAIGRPRLLSHEDRLARKRAYQAKLRARNIAAGFTSGGKPRKLIPTGDLPKEEQRRLAKRRVYQRKLRKRYRMEGKDSRGQPLTERYKGYPRKNTKKIQYVYRKPDEAYVDMVSDKDMEPVTDQISHCPYCGKNIEKHLTQGK